MLYTEPPFSSSSCSDVRASVFTATENKYKKVLICTKKTAKDASKPWIILYKVSIMEEKCEGCWQLLLVLVFTEKLVQLLQPVAIRPNCQPSQPSKVKNNFTRETEKNKTQNKNRRFQFFPSSHVLFHFPLSCHSTESIFMPTKKNF